MHGTAVADFFDAVPIPSQHRFVVPKITITQQTIAKARRDAADAKARFEITDVQAPGLILRAGPTGLLWQFRFEMHGRGTRLVLGSVDEWSIAEARSLVLEGRKLIAGRIRRPDDEWVHEMRVSMGKAAAAPVTVAHRHSTFWTYKQAVTAYMEHVKRTKSPATYRDYRQTLGNGDLAQLAKRPVPSITRPDLSKIIAAVATSGRESTAEGMVRKLKPFWSWMSDDAQRGDTGVEHGIMAGLKAPPRSRLSEDQFEEAEAAIRYVPPMHEVGRILAIARSGALDEIVGLAIELLVFAPQRRRAIATARMDKMRAISPTEGLWRIPAPHRKTAIMRGEFSELVIPLPAPAWSAVKKAMDLGDPTDERRVFFQRRPRRAGDKMDHIDPSTLTHTLSYMPGVTASPHDLRRALATHGENDLGLSRFDTKTVLDHSRGQAPGDVTATSYALSDGTHYTWRIMRAWAEHVEKAYRDAIEFDDRLLDVEWIKQRIYEARERSKGRGKPVSLVKVSPANMWSEAEA
ncbi:integrase family protein [Devosia elaeis]|uniref:Integrase DNA-binding domain-containing protein n=1 Tax=Devosia elaeis TaxID=1770058 RepID=A0A178I0E2_9HYPH|nr:integrase family protein [Devosia elaeis]OAM77756.1 hypothetical protein A3840_08395 [Devosia elaeis]